MSLLNKLFSGNILYYPGCLTKFAGKSIEENYKKILNDAGVDFIVLADLEKCCGSPVLNAGFFDDFKKLAEDNLKIFKSHSVKKIITNCPSCYKVLKKDYSGILGGSWDIEVIHFMEFALSAAESGKIRLPKYENLTVTFHDPCHLGKKSGIYEQPRKLLKMMGIELKEMNLSKTDSFCCGGGGGLQTNKTELANEVAKERLKQAEETGVLVLTSPCPLCTLHLQRNSGRIQVCEFSELLLGKIKAINNNDTAAGQMQAVKRL
ncbi:(Fe-S)-binding protein [Candidatus Parcubacteria bacterium]|nr:MAG: (Fe-S)-binding protein [Candidatus Parcubacteria bacterium]